MMRRLPSLRSAPSLSYPPGPPYWSFSHSLFQNMIHKDGVVDPSKWAHTLLDHTLEEGTEDNVTILVVSLSDAKLHELPVHDKVRKRREKLARSTDEESSGK